MNRVTKMRISDQVAEQLYTLIQQRQLQSGQRLPAERQLAEELGVSRTALREAIQKLSSRGLLESRVGAGTFVQTPPSQPNWHEQVISPLVPLMRDDPSTATTYWKPAKVWKSAPPGMRHNAQPPRTRRAFSAALTLCCTTSTYKIPKPLPTPMRSSIWRLRRLPTMPSSCNSCAACLS